MDGDGAPGSGPTPHGPSLGDDLAAYDELLNLSVGTDPEPPGVGPRAPRSREKELIIRLGVVRMTLAFSVIIIIILLALLVLLSRSSGGGTPAVGAGDPAAPAQQGDAASPAVDEAQPGAGGDGGDAQPVDEQGSTIEACVASATAVKLEIADEEREELRAQVGGGPVQGYQRWVRWKQVYRSATEDPVVVIEHYTRDAGGDVEPESGWDTGSVQAPTPGDVVQRDAFRGFKVSMYGDVDPAWDYVDRVAIMRDRPECVPLWKDETVLDRIAREVPLPAAPESD